MNKKDEKKRKRHPFFACVKVVLRAFRKKPRARHDGLGGDHRGRGCLHRDRRGHHRLHKQEKE